MSGAWIVGLSSCADAGEPLAQMQSAQCAVGFWGSSTPSSPEPVYIAGKPLHYRWELEGLSWNVTHLYRPQTSADYAAQGIVQPKPADEPTDSVWMLWDVETRKHFVMQHFVATDRPADWSDARKVRWEEFRLLDARSMDAQLKQYLHPQLKSEFGTGQWEIVSHREHPFTNLRDWSAVLDRTERVVQSSRSGGIHAWMLLSTDALRDPKRRLALAMLLAQFNEYFMLSALVSDHVRLHPDRFESLWREGAAPEPPPTDQLNVMHPLVGIRAVNYLDLVDQAIAGAPQLKYQFVALRSETFDGRAFQPLDDGYLGVEFRHGDGREISAKWLAKATEVMVEPGRAFHIEVNAPAYELHSLEHASRLDVAQLMIALRAIRPEKADSLWAAAEWAGERYGQRDHLWGHAMFDRDVFAARALMPMLAWWERPNMRDIESFLLHARRAYIDALPPPPNENTDRDEHLRQVVDALASWGYEVHAKLKPRF